MYEWTIEVDERVESVGAAASWPGRIRELAARRRAPGDARERDTLLADLWMLLGLVLAYYARSYARRFGGLAEDDAADVAADKALDLIGRLQCGQWDPVASTDAQVRGFLAAVARNGVIDLLRARSREVPAAAPSTSTRRDPSPVVEDDADPVEAFLDGARCARAIVECARILTARCRLAWFLRAFGELSSAQIARHPGVLSSRAGVDLMLHRSRRHIRKCLESKGFGTGRMPPGTFVALWEMIDGETRGRATSDPPERRR